MSRGLALGLYRHWILLGTPLIFLAAFGLWTTITGVIAVSRKARLFSVPLDAAQEISFDEAGRVALSMEAPRFSRQFAGVRFELYGLDGLRVAARPSLLRQHTMGLGTVRVELSTFDIPHPGRYRLVITGLDPAGSREPGHAVAFTRPHTVQTAAYVAGIALSAAVLITSLVLLILRLKETGFRE